MVQSATASASGTRARSYHAAWVTRRVKTDLQSIKRLFWCSGLDRLLDYAHDIELGIQQNCLGSFSFVLLDPGTRRAVRAYTYSVRDGSFESSPHGGRIEDDPTLIGTICEIHVTPSNRPRWERLKQSDSLKIGWAPARAHDLSHLRASNDGGYASGDVGVARSCYK